MSSNQTQDLNFFPHKAPQFRSEDSFQLQKTINIIFLCRSNLSDGAWTALL